LRKHREASIGVAFGLKAFLGRLKDAVQQYQGGEESWRLTFQVDQADYGAGFMEMSTSGYSADDIATLRARRILLNEQRPMSSADVVSMLNGSTLEVLIRGMNTPLQITSSPLPALFADTGNDRAAFVSAARLLLVLYLRLSGVVEHVFKLDLKFESRERVWVDFNGQRPRKFTNVEAPTVTVSGLCDLGTHEAG
jgi:hypothetical protein